MTNNEFISIIKKHYKYRGQLLPYKTINSSNTKEKSSLTPELDYLLESLELKLFDYQEKALSSFQMNKDIFMVGGYGTGISTTIDILSIYSLFYKGKSILYLEPNAKKLEEKTIRLKERFSKLKEIMPSKIVFTDSSEHLIKTLEQYPDIVLTTTENFYNCIKKYHTKKFLRDFVFSLGLISIERIELYGTKEIIFLTRVISLLNSLSSSRFVVSSSTDEDYSTFCNLLNSSINFELIKNSNFIKNNYIYYWLPPFEVNLLEDMNTFHYKRKNYLKEINNLLEMVEDAHADNNNILIWHAFEKLTSHIRKGLSVRSNITVTNDLGNLFVDFNKAFDVAIIIGMPRNFKHLTYNINNFLRDGGTVFIIPPDDLLSYLLVWSEFKFEDLPGRKLFHLSETALLNDLFANIKKSMLGRILDNHFIPSWGVITNNFINVEYPSGQSRQVDKDLIPFNMYQGKILFEQEKCFKAYIEETQDEKIIKLITPSGNYIKSVPIIDFSINKIESLERKKGTKYYNVEIIKSRLFLKHSSTILFEDHSQEAKRDIEEFSPPYMYEKEVRGVRLKTKFPDEMEHLIYNFLPLLFHNPFEILLVIKDDDYLYLFPHQDKLFHFVEKNFYLDINSTIQNLFNFAYRAIKECPCKTGCSKCLYFAYHKDTSGLDKEKFGIFLAEYFGKEEVENYENLINFRNGNLNNINKLTNFYNEIKRKIIDILNNNLDITFANPVPLKVVKNLKPGVLGIYNGKNVKVIPLTQQHAIGVITHEYIHNWQDQVGILARGDKFIYEGSAQWLSTKVLNYYYRIDEIETDIMGTSSEELKEYFNGFQFLQEVEEKDGYMNIITALIEDSWTQEQLKIRQKWEEYRLL